MNLTGRSSIRLTAAVRNMCLRPRLTPWLPPTSRCWWMRSWFKESRSTLAICSSMLGVWWEAQRLISCLAPSHRATVPKVSSGTPECRFQR